MNLICWMRSGYGEQRRNVGTPYDDYLSDGMTRTVEYFWGNDLSGTEQGASLIRDGHFTGDISITVVTDPLLDPSQGREYCQSELEVKFGTFKGFESRDMSKRNVRNEFKLAGAQNLLLPEIYSNQKMKKNAELLRERMLIRFGKYHPVKKFSLNLGAARDKQLKNALGADSRWYLQLKSVFRSQTESRIVRPAQRFCTIITVHDFEGDGTLNHEMLDLMVRAKLYAGELTIRSEVPIEVRG